MSFCTWNLTASYSFLARDSSLAGLRGVWLVLGDLSKRAPKLVEYILVILLIKIDQNSHQLTNINYDLNSK